MCKETVVYPGLSTPTGSGFHCGLGAHPPQVSEVPVLPTLYHLRAPPTPPVLPPQATVHPRPPVTSPSTAVPSPPPNHPSFQLASPHPAAPRVFTLPTSILHDPTAPFPTAHPSRGHPGGDHLPLTFSHLLTWHRPSPTPSSPVCTPHSTVCCTERSSFLTVRAISHRFSSPSSPASPPRQFSDLPRPLLITRHPHGPRSPSRYPHVPSSGPFFLPALSLFALLPVQQYNLPLILQPHPSNPLAPSSPPAAPAPRPAPRPTLLLLRSGFASHWQPPPALSQPSAPTPHPCQYPLCLVISPCRVVPTPSTEPRGSPGFPIHSPSFHPSTSYSRSPTWLPAPHTLHRLLLPGDTPHFLSHDPLGRAP